MVAYGKFKYGLTPYVVETKAVCNMLNTNMH
jgi:hypothetical protein